MRRPYALTLLCLLLFIGLSACDTTQNGGVAESDDDQDTETLSDEQIDYSFVTQEQQAMLLSDGPLQESQLLRFGFRLSGAVFTMSDETDGNEVIAFRRNPSGRLRFVGSYPTNGTGSGDGLNGTSNPMALALGNRYLVAVNGGSDEVSLFKVRGARLELVDVIPSGGPRPISITVYKRWVYVINAGREGEPGNINGFVIAPGDQLAPLFGSTQPLNEDAGNPSQIDFNPLGTQIVITDKPSNTITTYPVNDSGIAGEPNTQHSAGTTPFGFDFDREGRLHVSEANGGAELGSSMSSYLLNGGFINLLSGVIPTNQTAACWVETFGAYAYTTNTGSGSVTGFRINPDGTLERLDEDGITFTTGEGSQPLDMDIALRYLFVHSQGNDRIGVYRIERDGSATSVPNAAATGLPPTAVGVAAY